MKKIKIIGSAYPYRGGLATYNERLAHEFAIAGCDVEIETFTLQYPSLLFPGKSQYTESTKPEGLSIKRSVNSVNPLNWLKTGFRIRKEIPDILIIKYWIPFMAPCFGTIARLAKGNKKTRVICIADNIIPHEKRAGDSSLTHYFLRHIDGLVAMSGSVLNDALSFRPDLPVRLCPHPLFDNFGELLNREEALTRLGLKNDFRYILFFGFIRDYKGLDWLLEAFANQKLRKFPLKLIVAGEFYADSKPYLEQIKKSGLSDWVIMKNDFIPNDQVNQFFSASDLVVQPYKSATQSGVTQIGYHFNKPMLVTDVGGLAEIIPDGKAGYVVKPEIESIADAIFDFFENNRMEYFTENVKTEKLKFTWSRMVEAIFDVNNEAQKS